MRNLRIFICLGLMLIVAGNIVFGQSQKVSINEPVSTVNSSIGDYQPSQLPSSQNPMPAIGALLKIIVSLIIIVTFVYLTVYILKMISAPAGSLDETNLGNLELVDTLYISPGKAVHMIYVGKDILVISSVEKNITFLSKIEDAQVVESILKKRREKFESAKPFGDYLRIAQKKYAIKNYFTKYIASIKDMFRNKKSI